MYSRNGTLNAAIADDIGMPLLPDGVIPEGDDSHQWLDDYCEWSSYMSPSGYAGFHEACALWLLSTVALRRIVIKYGGPQFTPLFVLLAARTSVWAKTTTLKRARAVLTSAGVDYVLMPRGCSPQKFQSLMTLQLPDKYKEMSRGDKEVCLKALAFAGQKGWIYEEFGEHIVSMTRPNSYMSNFSALLRYLDDCDDRWVNATQVRDLEIVTDPYLTLIGTITPADMKPFANADNPLWGNGFWARFCFSCPPSSLEPSDEDFHDDDRDPPSHVVGMLAAMHERLGTRKCVLHDKGELTVNPLPQVYMTFDPVARQCVKDYWRVLRAMTNKSENEDLAGNYGRFSNKALRIMLLLASIEGSTVVTKRHCIRAMHIAEHFRMSVHALHESTNKISSSKELRDEERVMKALIKAGQFCAPGDIAQRLSNVTATQALKTLAGLVLAERIVSRPGPSRGILHFGLRSWESCDSESNLTNED